MKTDMLTKRLLAATRRRKRLEVAVAAVAGAIIAAAILFLVPSHPSEVPADRLAAITDLARLQQDNDVLRAEVDRLRIELEYACIDCNAELFWCKKALTANTDDTPPPSSGFGSCAITWREVLDRERGIRQLFEFGRAVELRWGPWKQARPKRGGAR